MTYLFRITALVVAFLTFAVVLPPGQNTAAAQTGDDAVLQISMGGSHACALMQSGRVMCWGNNTWGQLGNGTNTASVLPTYVRNISSATAISSGTLGTCALMQNRTVQCWGDNRNGQIGEYTRGQPAWTPLQVRNLNGVASITSGASHNCALLRTGRITCWGNNSIGQMGNGQTFSRTIIYNQDLHGVQLIDNATSVVSQQNHTCALLADTTVKCWGYNNTGQLGDGTQYTSLLPLSVPNLSGVVSLATGSNHTCAVLQSGDVQCWGFLQNASQTGADITAPTAVPGISGATSVAASSSHTCALSSGSIKCWGQNWAGQLGNGATLNSFTPVDVLNIDNAASIAANGSSTCALLDSGEVRCWGRRALGLSANSSVPIPVVFGPTRIRLVSGSATSADGWFVFGNTARFINSACVTQLKNAGESFTQWPWSDINALDRVPGAVICNGIEELIDAAGQQDGPTPPTPDPETTDPETPAGSVQWVTNNATNDAGWAITGGTRQWLSATCRAQLEAAGATFAVNTWAGISATPNTTSPQTCDALQTQIGSTTTTGTSSVAFVTNSNSNTAGWAITGGSRQWLPPACRSQLEAAGATFTLTPWPEISAATTTSSPQTCDVLETRIGDTTTTTTTTTTTNTGDGALFETTANVNGGFWIEGGERQWLSNECMTQLKAGGATVTAVPWTQISANTDNANLTTCANLLADL